MKITVVVPAHPARIRNGMLQRALTSVATQTRRPDDLIVEFDYWRNGSASTRNAALRRVQTDWVAFLDSDDRLFPGHLELLEQFAQETGADLVYPWYAHPGRDDPYPGRFRCLFDEQALYVANYIPVTVLCRRDLVTSSGWFQPDFTIAPPAQCDEWGLWKRMLQRNVIDGKGRHQRGARFAHLPERTWEWNAHQGNTSGSPRLGDAKLDG